MRVFDYPIVKKSFSYFFIICLLIQTSSCKYYQVSTAEKDFQTTINEIGEVYKDFILHDKDLMYLISDMSLDKTYLYGKVEAIEDVQLVYYDKDSQDRRYNVYTKNILNEVHIYLHEDKEQLNFETSSLPLSHIKEIRIIDKDSGKTVASHVFTIVGVGVGVFAVIAIIAILTKSSCPYVYVDDGEGFVFEGETFGGAIGQNMQRDDYMPLPSIKAKNGAYRLRISNELKERQYIDVADLMVFSHTENQHILLDKNGDPQIIELLQSPTDATEIGGGSLELLLEKKDQIVYQFDHVSESDNGIVLDFEKPEHVAKGKLVFNAKNSLWFDYVFGEVLKKFASSFDLAMDRHAALPASERYQTIKEQEFPLSVFVMKNKKWHLVETINTVGPLASRDFVVPIDLNDITEDKVSIKLETGFMFWEVDYVGMDFSVDIIPEAHLLKPTEAFGTGNNNWTAALRETDGSYMAQENVGEITEIIYEIPKALQGDCLSAFLHTSGYYELIRDFEGLPQISELKKFKEPGYFSEYSKQGFLKTIKIEEEHFVLEETD